MGLFDRERRKQTREERGRLRQRLRELEGEREEQLRDLGRIAFEMHQRDGFDRDLLWSKAAEVAATDDEAKLVRRGLDEGLGLEQLREPADG